MLRVLNVLDGFLFASVPDYYPTEPLSKANLLSKTDRNLCPDTLRYYNAKCNFLKRKIIILSFKLTPPVFYTMVVSFKPMMVAKHSERIFMVNFAHVGIQKTGSTWLQTGLLKHHPQLQIIGPYERHHPLAPLQQLVGKLYQTPRDAWNREGWLDEFNTYKYLLKPDALVGLSNEQLGGHIFTLENGLWAAERMQDLFGTIKIILVLRHPYTYIHSGYVQSVKSGTCTVVEEEMLQNDAKRASIVNRINYALLIQEYISRFGKENLLVLPFEMLKQDDGTFITYITRFLDIEPWEVSMMRGNTRENRSISAFSLGLLRYANRADQHMGRFFPEKARYLNRTIRWVANRNPLEQRLPKTLDLAPKLLHAYPEFDQLLRDENYVFWDGELSQFNYRFITE